MSDTSDELTPEAAWRLALEASRRTQVAHGPGESIAKHELKIGERRFEVYEVNGVFECVYPSLSGEERSALELLLPALASGTNALTTEQEDAIAVLLRPYTGLQMLYIRPNKSSGYNVSLQPTGEVRESGITAAEVAAIIAELPPNAAIELPADDHTATRIGAALQKRGGAQ